MFKKSKIWNYLAYALGEILLIVMGILIALYLQNRNEQKKTDASVNTTLEMIQNEIKTNRKQIARVKNYHIMLRDTLKKIEVPKTKEAFDREFTFWQGMNIPRLQDAAFQATIQSGVSKEFGPELLQKLYSLYTLQDSYNAFTTSSTQIFFNVDLSDMRNTAKIMASVEIIMNDLYFYEHNLVQLFDDNLQKIDSIRNFE